MSDDADSLWNFVRDLMKDPAALEEACRSARLNAVDREALDREMGKLFVHLQIWRRYDVLRAFLSGLSGREPNASQRPDPLS